MDALGAGHAGKNLIDGEQKSFRHTVRELRAMVKSHRLANADVTVERIPEVFCYRICPNDNSTPFTLFCCPVELLGIEPAPKPERVIKEKVVDPEKEAAKAVKAAEREAAKVARVAEREAAKAAKLEEKAAKAAAKAAEAAEAVVRAGAMSGSETVQLELTQSLAEAMANADGSHDA